MIIRACEERDIPSMTAIWNQVVREGLSFLRKELPDERSGPDFLRSKATRVFWRMRTKIEKGEALWRKY